MTEKTTRIATVIVCSLLLDTMTAMLFRSLSQMLIVELDYGET